MIKKIISTLLIASVISFAIPSNNAKANYPVFDGANFGENVIHYLLRILEEALEVIENTYTVWEDEVSAILKLEMTDMITSMVDTYIQEGNNGRPYYVEDWDSYLATEPVNNADASVESFFNSQGYNNVGYDGYKKALYYEAREIAYGPPLKPQVGVTDVAGTQLLQQDLLADPSNEFRPLQALLQPTEYPIMSQQMLLDHQRNKFEEEKEKAEHEQVDGALPRKDIIGNTVTPAATNLDILNEALQMKNNIIVNAGDPYELAQAVMTGFFTNTISGATDGLGQFSGVTF